MNVEASTKYPDIKVKLTGHDGNAYAVMGRVSAALRKGGVSADEIKAFMSEAKSGDYDHLLRTCTAWVAVS